MPFCCPPDGPFYLCTLPRLWADRRGLLSRQASRPSGFRWPMRTQTRDGKFEETELEVAILAPSINNQQNQTLVNKVLRTVLFTHAVAISQRAQQELDSTSLK